MLNSQKVACDVEEPRALLTTRGNLHAQERQ
jgi:hypothetical protein